MVFSSIDTSNYKKQETNGKTQIQNFIDAIHNKKTSLFILFYMEGCGPCNATRPEWSKLKNVLKQYEQDDKVVIADIENIVAGKYSKEIEPIEEPNGFPTIIFVTDEGKVIENYGNNLDRNVDAFVKWINSKIKANINKLNGGTRKRNKHGKRGKKWSSKYKKSINCKKPKGFSQKQYCKYSR